MYLMAKVSGDEVVELTIKRQIGDDFGNVGHKEYSLWWNMKTQRAIHQ